MLVHRPKVVDSCGVESLTLEPFGLPFVDQMRLMDFEPVRYGITRLSNLVCKYSPGGTSSPGNPPAVLCSQAEPHVTSAHFGEPTADCPDRIAQLLTGELFLCFARAIQSPFLTSPPDCHQTQNIISLQCTRGHQDNPPQRIFIMIKFVLHILQYFLVVMSQLPHILQMWVQHVIRYLL
jgi:hypothetical protein